MEEGCPKATLRVHILPAHRLHAVDPKSIRGEEGGGANQTKRKKLNEKMESFRNVHTHC